MCLPERIGIESAVDISVCGCIISQNKYAFCSPVSINAICFDASKDTCRMLFFILESGSFKSGAPGKHLTQC